MQESLDDGGRVRRAAGFAGEFLGGLQLNGRAGQRARQHEADNRRVAQPALPFAPPVGEGVQAQPQEAIYRGLSGPGQDQGGPHQAAKSRIANGGDIDRPPVGHQQPWEHGRRRKQAHLRGVAREEAGKPVGEHAQHRRHAVLDIAGDQQISDQAGQQHVQSQLQLDGARSDAGQQERPVGRVPRGHLRIGQKRVAGEHVGSPERKLAG